MSRGTRVRSEMGELPAAQRVRLGRDYGLSAYDVGVLTRQGRATVAYFEDTARRAGDAKAASNWVTNRVLATLKERKQEIRDFPLTAERLAELIAAQKASGLSKQAAEEVYNRMLESGGSAPEAIAQLGIHAVDEGALRTRCAGRWRPTRPPWRSTRKARRRRSTRSSARSCAKRRVPTPTPFGG